MRYAELKRRLRRLGVEFRRQGKEHELWGKPGTTLTTAIPRHRGEVPTGTLHSILRDLGLTMEDLERV